jgi:hypothetical protein
MTSSFIASAFHVPVRERSCPEPIVDQRVGLNIDDFNLISRKSSLFIYREGESARPVHSPTNGLVCITSRARDPNQHLSICKKPIRSIEIHSKFMEDVVLMVFGLEKKFTATGTTPWA